VSATADGGTDSSGPANRLGFKAGMVVQELGWDQDTDDQLRISIEDAIDGDMVDSDHGNVVEAVVLWWRDDDGDLVDALVDSLISLDDGGVVWLLTLKTDRPGHVEPGEIGDAAPTAGLHQTSSISAAPEWSGTRLVARRSNR
jgi:hypothetical protein